MTQEVFSPAFWEKIRRPRPAHPRVAAVDREAQELAVAAIFARSGESVVWLGGENEALGGKKGKAPPVAEVLRREEAPVHVHLLPFEDPYINTAADTRAHRGQAAAAGRPRRRQENDRAVDAGRPFHPPRADRRRGAGDGALEIRAGDLWERNDLIDRLTGLGYQTRDAVEIGGDAVLARQRGRRLPGRRRAAGAPGVRGPAPGLAALLRPGQPALDRHGRGPCASARNRYFSGPGGDAALAERPRSAPPI